MKIMEHSTENLSQPPHTQPCVCRLPNKQSTLAVSVWHNVHSSFLPPCGSHLVLLPDLVGVVGHHVQRMDIVDCIAASLGLGSRSSLE